MENLNLIWTIISTFLALGGIVIIKNLVKESKELAAKIKEAYIDGNIDAEEALEIAKEAVDVYSEGLKLWKLLKKVIPFKNKVK